MEQPFGQLHARRSSLPRCGEVVAAQVAEFEAQCDQLLAIYGLVAGISTGGVDTGMRPVPRGRAGCEDAEIFRAHPDLAHLLATTVRCLVVGFCQGGAMYRYLPSQPAPIHYSVVGCDPSDLDQFTRDFGYFSMVIAARDLPVEEVLAAHIRHAADARDLGTSEAEGPYAFSVRAGRALAQLLRGEPQRLSTILQRIRRSRPDEPAWEAGSPAQPLAQALTP